MSKNSWIGAIVILICFIKLLGNDPAPTTITDTGSDPNVNGYNYHENSKIPKDYYIKPKKPIAQTYPRLKQAIMGGVIKPYELDVYDCSEMSAYMEWKLENLGFNATVCSADNFRDSGVGHAWIKVDLEHTKPCYVETTALSNTIGVPYGTIIRGNDRDAEKYENYSRYDRIYEDIYQLTANRRTSEFDWWNSVNFSKEASRIRKLNS